MAGDGKDKPKDLVISYSMLPSTVEYVHPKVQDALDRGYRVIDIISSPASSFVAVTVLLTASDAEAWYKRI